MSAAEILPPLQNDVRRYLPSGRKRPDFPPNNPGY